MNGEERTSPTPNHYFDCLRHTPNPKYLSNRSMCCLYATDKELILINLALHYHQLSERHRLSLPCANI